MKRIEQVNQLIKKELSQIMIREVEFPVGAMVTVTRVDTSSNLIQSTVYISVMPDSEMKETMRRLNGIIYYLQQLLNKRLKMRPIPKIIFKEEKETVRAEEVEEILEDIKNKKA